MVSKNNNTAGVVLDIIKELNADIYALQEIEDTLLLKQTVSNLSSIFNAILRVVIMEV